MIPCKQNCTLFIIQLLLISVGGWLLPGCQTAPTSPPPTGIAPQATNAPTPTRDDVSFLADTIRYVNDQERYHIHFTVAENDESSQVTCQFENQTTFFCRNETNTASGRDTVLLLQYDDHVWLKQTADQAEWQYVPDGVKVGYQGLNHLALVQQTTQITEEVDEGMPVYRLDYLFDPALLLPLLLNNPETAATLAQTAAPENVTGAIWMEQISGRPRRETVAIAIDDPFFPLTLDLALTYDFTTPVEIPLPLAQELLWLADDFLAAVRDDELDAAYALFSDRAQQTVSAAALTTYANENRPLFHQYQSLTLRQSISDPEALDGDTFHQLDITAVYATQPDRPFRFHFENEGEQWRLYRFTALEPAGAEN